MNQYTVDIEGRKLIPQQWFVKISSYQGEGGMWFHNQKEADKKYCELQKYEGQLQAHTEKPVFIEKQNIDIDPADWVGVKEVREDQFTLQHQVDDVLAPGWFDIDKDGYDNVDTFLYNRRIIARPKREEQKVEKPDEEWKLIEAFNKWALDKGWRFVEGVNGTLWEKLERDENRNVKASYKSTFLLYQLYKFNL